MDRIKYVKYPFSWEITKDYLKRINAVKRIIGIMKANDITFDDIHIELKDMEVERIKELYEHIGFCNEEV